MSENKSHSPSYRIPLDGGRLRQARQKAGLTLTEAADMADINKMTLARYESGDILSVAAARLCRLADLYQSPPFWLAGLDAGQEFYTEGQGLLLSPEMSKKSPGLGKRLLSCLHFLGEQGR